MGELLGGLLGGFLEGFFGSMIGDLSSSAIGKIVLFALYGEPGSRFLIQRADAARGPEGLRRETMRRRRMKWEFGLLLFFMAAEAFLWIISLLVNDGSDFTGWLRRYGFPVFAGTTIVFLLYLLISRAAVSRRIRSAPPFSPGCPEPEFAVYRYRKAAGISLKLSFGMVSGFFAILAAVLWLVGRSGPPLFLIVVLLFLMAVVLVSMALLDRTDLIPAVTLTQEGILPEKDSPVRDRIAWEEIREYTVKDGVLEIRMEESEETPDTTLSLDLGSSVYSAEIIRYKIEQYLAAGGFRPGGKEHSRLDMK